MKRLLVASVIAAVLAGFPGFAQQPPPLIVVEDHGGVSALPYYEALDLQPAATPPASPTEAPQIPTHRFGEADMLPVRSARLAPGEAPPRTIQAPGLTPLFLVGDDDRSRAWLRAHAQRLRERHAMGLVVNVETAEALAALRSLAPGLTLAPVSADDLAERLDLHTYPALISATGIEP